MLGSKRGRRKYRSSHGSRRRSLQFLSFMFSNLRRVHCLNDCYLCNVSSKKYMRAFCAPATIFFGFLKYFEELYVRYQTRDPRDNPLDLPLQIFCISEIWQILSWNSFFSQKVTHSKIVKKSGRLPETLEEMDRTDFSKLQKSRIFVSCYRTRVVHHEFVQESGMFQRAESSKSNDYNWLSWIVVISLSNKLKWYSCVVVRNREISLLVKICKLKFPDFEIFQILKKYFLNVRLLTVRMSDLRTFQRQQQYCSQAEMVCVFSFFEKHFIYYQIQVPIERMTTRLQKLLTTNHVNFTVRCPTSSVWWSFLFDLVSISDPFV